MDHPTLADGRYVVQRCIGHGGMAAVFLVYDNTFKAARAIKVLKPALVVRPESRMRFRTEAIAMARLNHPHIVRVFDQGMEGMTSYIVMDYFPHGSLQAYLRVHGVLPREIALSLSLDLADALAHAHQTGVIHRDVKPDNVLMSPEGAQLTDFGLARISAMAMGMTRTRAVIGTPSYMSPEQRLSTKRSSHLTDIYSLTATLFSMLSSEDPIDLYDEDAQDGLLSSLDADIAAVIRSGCHADQSQRFQSVAALATALEGLRETPHAPRKRISPLPMPTNTPPVDLSNLRRLWASYTSPSQDQVNLPSKSNSATISVEQFDVSEAAEQPQQAMAEPAELLGSATPPQQAPAPWRRPVVAMLLLMGVLGAGAVALQVTSEPETASLQLKLPQDQQDEQRLEQAIASLLDADLSRARQLLGGLVEAYPDEPAVHSAQAMLLFVQKQPQRAAAAAHQAAVLSQDQPDPMSQMLVLGDASGADSSVPPDVRRARWAPLRAAASSAEVELLYLVSTWGYPDKGGQKQALQAARERHPDVEIFASLDVRRHHETARTPAEHAHLMALLDAALADFPDSAMLLLQRGQLLLMRGKVDAAAEVMSQVSRLDEAIIQTRIHQSEIAALRDDEVERASLLMIAIGDTVPPLDQRAFLLESGLMVAGLGQRALAEETWRFGIDETDSVVDDQQCLTYYVPILEAQLAIHGEGTDTWISWLNISKQCLRDAGLDAAQAAFWSSSVTYMEAVRATRLDQLDRATAMLSELEALAAQRPALQRAPSHVDRLRLELALAAEEPVEAELSLLLEAIPSTPSEACFAAWAQARAASAQGLAAGGPVAQAQLERLQEAAAVLDSHSCIVAPREWSLQRAEALLLQSELAMAVGQQDAAQDAAERFRTHWPQADEDLPFVMRVAAVEGWLQSPE